MTRQNSCDDSQCGYLTSWELMMHFLFDLIGTTFMGFFPGTSPIAARPRFNFFTWNWKPGALLNHNLHKLKELKPSACINPLVLSKVFLVFVVSALLQTW